MATRTPRPRLFRLERHTDISGISGTGHIADGVLWPDGTATLRWLGEHPSTVFWDRGHTSVDHIHGHGGATSIVFDEPLTLTADQRALAANAVSTALNALGCWHSQDDCRTIADAALNAATGRLDCITTQERTL